MKKIESLWIQRNIPKIKKMNGQPLSINGINALSTFQGHKIDQKSCWKNLNSTEKILKQTFIVELFSI